MRIDPNAKVKLCIDCKYNDDGGFRCLVYELEKAEARALCKGDYWQPNRVISRGLAEIRLHTEVYGKRTP